MLDSDDRAQSVFPVPICIGTGFFILVKSKKPSHKRRL